MRSARTFVVVPPKDSASFVAPFARNPPADARNGRTSLRAAQAPLMAVQKP
jgi:hypothetical protein